MLLNWHSPLLLPGLFINFWMESFLWGWTRYSLLQFSSIHCWHLCSWMHAIQIFFSTSWYRSWFLCNTHIIYFITQILCLLFKLSLLSLFKHTLWCRIHYWELYLTCLILYMLFFPFNKLLSTYFFKSSLILKEFI